LKDSALSTPLLALSYVKAEVARMKDNNGLLFASLLRICYLMHHNCSFVVVAGAGLKAGE